MILSNAQLIGLALDGFLIFSALLLLWYVTPRVNATFRPSIKLAIYWFIGILLIQTVFVLIAA